MKDQDAWQKRAERAEHALFTILANTEPNAMKHASYDALAKDIADCAEAALRAIRSKP